MYAKNLDIKIKNTPSTFVAGCVSIIIVGIDTLSRRDTILSRTGHPVDFYFRHAPSPNLNTRTLKL